MPSTDYSHQNLQDQSFANLDLTEANFSYSDLRGCDFTGAILTGANFHHCTTGQSRKQILVGIAAPFAGVFTGVVIFAGTIVIVNTMLGGIYNIIGCLTLIIGLLGSIGVPGVISYTVTAYLLGTGNLNAKALSVLISSPGWYLQSLMIFVFAASPWFLFEKDCHPYNDRSNANEYFTDPIPGEHICAAAIVLALAVLVPIAASGAFFLAFIEGQTIEGISSALFALVCFYHLIHRFSDITYRIKQEIGTNFSRANLSYADFSEAVLENTDFFRSNTEMVYWANTSFFHCRLPPEVDEHKKIVSESSCVITWSYENYFITTKKSPQRTKGSKGRKGKG